jgi:hypothetical protein
MRGIMRTTGSLLLGTAAAAVFVTTIYGQNSDSIRGAPSAANHFIATPAGWVHPKTPWGEPDIQAMLNMMQAAGVPLERCAGNRNCDKNKAWLTEEEYNQRLAAAAGRVDRGRQLIEQGNYGQALLSGVTDPSTPQRQTSLIVDPANGQLPEITAEGKKRALQMGSSWSLPAEDPVYDDALDFDFWDNCRSRGMPSSMMPYRYNGGFRIMQAPGVVVFDLEMIHDSRIIYTDGRKALGGPIKQYMGESRGRWEGNTLVVETTNYKEGPPLINLAVPGSPAGNRFPVSDRMKTTERITRLNNDMWLYEIKTEDPVVLTRPFTVRYPMRNSPGYEWWEYACHEGNTIIQNYSETNKHEIANPPQEPPVQTAKLTPEATKALVGRWTGKPEVDTVDYNVFLEFTSNPDGTVQGKLVGTDLKTFRGKVKPNVNKALRAFRVGCVGAGPGGGGGRGAGGGAPGGGGGRGGGAPAPGGAQVGPGGGLASSCEQPGAVSLNFELPNTQPWTFAGQLAADGSTITGSFSSAQGGVPVVFKKQ